MHKMVKINFPYAQKNLNARTAQVSLPLSLKIWDTRITHPRTSLGIGVHHPQLLHQLLLLPRNNGGVEVTYLVAGIASELGMTIVIIGSNARIKEDGVGVGNVASLSNL